MNYHGAGELQDGVGEQASEVAELAVGKRMLVELGIVDAVAEAAEVVEEQTAVVVAEEQIVVAVAEEQTAVVEQKTAVVGEQIVEAEPQIAVAAVLVLLE